jgi:hypothetical protein
MNCSENAKHFYQQYAAKLSTTFIMWVQCAKGSDTHKAIEELRDAGIISVEDGQVVDDNGDKVADLFGISNLCKL